MNSSLPPKPKSSWDRSFDDMVDRRRWHLLFRLHSHHYCWTFFHPQEEILVASLHREKLSEDSTNEETSLQLIALEEVPSLLNLEEVSEAVEKHITSWCNRIKEPSNYISLTFDVLYVLWSWKWRIPSQSKGCQDDDFRIIVLNSSKLRASGRAKLGTQMLSSETEKQKEARNFARAHEEVIVAKYIQSEVIIGSMPMSRLEAFIPSWFRGLLETTEGSKKSTSAFLKSLPPAVPVDKVDRDRIRESLRFSLALLAPMLLPDKQQRANIGSGKEASCGATEHSSTADNGPRVESRETVEVSGRRLSTDGYVFIKTLPYKPIIYHVLFKRKSDSCIGQEAEQFPGDGKPSGRDDWRMSRRGASGQAEKTFRGRTAPT